MSLNQETINLARQLRERLAGSHLPPIFAKLYSQHTQLSAGRPGLVHWGEREADDRLDDAVRLIEAALVERESGSDQWTNGVRRAGEILEWLSHYKLNRHNLPIRFLAAAAYQLAGYPARSTGLLNEDVLEGTESQIIYSLLRADFPTLLEHLVKYWSAHKTKIPKTSKPILSNEGTSQNFNHWVIDETVSALGIICATMRWGDEPRTKKAIDKLSDVSKILIHGTDPYSWLLAKLCAEAASTYINNSIRTHTRKLIDGMTSSGQLALERYVRQSYQTKRSLVWPSQIRGIERLVGKKSFALCTPTGSGKTAIAELAILQSLFTEQNRENAAFPSIEQSKPLAIYLTPSRALATEVETKLSRVLRGITDEKIIVTGLYGGTDWGPTDAWLTADDKTVLICTYEKAEALMRFLGPLFLHKLALVVIDEAHYIQFDGNRDRLRTSDSRALRLESLGSRLLSYLDQKHSRVIALSAVASGVENAIASWITGQTDATPVKVSYRSTRQLIGRLECLHGGEFQIYYDLLDGASLKFDTSAAGTLFIPHPFPPCPTKIKETSGPEKRLRPYLFWAAINLASVNNKGQQSAVLISVTQYVGGYAKDFLQLLSAWSKEKTPVFFVSPTDAEKQDLWNKCLRSCEDYFGTKSYEYQLLEKGVAVHHGKMPGLMARLLVQVIEERIVHLVLATSTLSEGVNLPFETVLIPSLRRGTTDISPREFANLVGRAGRPGFGTEGKCLVLVGPDNPEEVNQLRKKYTSLISALNNQNPLTLATPSSPLAELLIHIWSLWDQMVSPNKLSSFAEWLEKTSPLILGDDSKDTNELLAVEALDSLDSLLLSAIVEVERIKGENVTIVELEEKLKTVWARSYARYANNEEKKLGSVFVYRGKALKTKVYSDSTQRRYLYNTGLPPRSGTQLLAVYRRVKEHLETGFQYILWDANQRFDFIKGTVELLRNVPKLRTKDTVEKNVYWPDALRWWLDPLGDKAHKPSAAKISSWHDFISRNFGYLFNWGLGSIIALAIEETYGWEMRSSSLQDWPKTGLPWIAFWMKELIVWGTLDPVAACLLAQGTELTRRDAERTAKQYYEGKLYLSSTDELLDASAIRKWANIFLERSDSSRSKNQSTLKVKLLRDFTNHSNNKWKVVPVEVDREIYWYDPAGFPLAICGKPERWKSRFVSTIDFVLDSLSKEVVCKHFI